MLINVFSFFDEVNLLVQTNILNGVELVVATIQAVLGFNRIELSVQKCKGV
jgi:hypothetical protein